MQSILLFTSVTSLLKWCATGTRNLFSPLGLVPGTNLVQVYLKIQSAKQYNSNLIKLSLLDFTVMTFVQMSAALNSDLMWDVLICLIQGFWCHGFNVTVNYVQAHTSFSHFLRMFLLTLAVAGQNE